MRPYLDLVDDAAVFILKGGVTPYIDKIYRYHHGGAVGLRA